MDTSTALGIARRLMARAETEADTLEEAVKMTAPWKDIRRMVGGRRLAKGVPGRVMRTLTAAVDAHLPSSTLIRSAVTPDRASAAYQQFRPTTSDVFFRGGTASQRMVAAGGVLRVAVDRRRLSQISRTSPVIIEHHAISRAFERSLLLDAAAGELLSLTEFTADLHPVGLMLAVSLGAGDFMTGTDERRVVLPFLDGLLLGSLTRHQDGSHYATELLVDGKAPREMTCTHPTVASDGTWLALELATFIGPHEMTAGQERIRSDLMVWARRHREAVKGVWEATMLGDGQGRIPGNMIQDVVAASEQVNLITSTGDWHNAVASREARVPALDAVAMA